MDKMQMNVKNMHKNHASVVVKGRDATTDRCSLDVAEKT